MSAASTDKFLKVGNPGTATTLSAPGHTIAGTAFTVGSTTNWPTDTGVICAIDTVTLVNGVEVRDTGSYTEWEVVVSSATSLTSAVLRYGTDQNYPAGSTTRVYIPVASSRENRQVDALLVSFDQDGTLKSGAVDVAAVLASDVVTTAKILDSNVTTAKIADLNVTNAKLAANAAWTSWTPTWTNLTVGNGTVSASYQQIGKTVHFRVRIKFGSTTSISGTVKTTYPVTPVDINAGNLTTTYSAVIGNTVTKDDNTGNTYQGFVLFVNTTAMQHTAFNTAGTYGQAQDLSSTVPFTWTTDDVIQSLGVYEAA